MKSTKQQLYELCVAYIAGKEKAIKDAIADVRAAAANETKSSAGDKYETAREMMQQEIDMNMTRLAELSHLQLILEQIHTDEPYSTAQPGAVVYTTNGNYYIAIGAGKLTVNDATYYAVSAASPIGAKLTGLRMHDTFLLNGKPYTISEVA